MFWVNPRPHSPSPTSFGFFTFLEGRLEAASGVRGGSAWWPLEESGKKEPLALAPGPLPPDCRAFGPLPLSGQNRPPPPWLPFPLWEPGSVAQEL